MSTNVLSNKDITRDWHQVDAAGMVVGRLATKVATILMGKNKAKFVPYMDNGDFVVVTNAAKVTVSGKKGVQKIYYRHSGFPGGLKSETFDHLLERRPEEVIRHAVKGMLPKNKLGRAMIKKLHVFADDNHKFAKQLGQKVVVEEKIEDVKGDSETSSE